MISTQNICRHFGLCGGCDSLDRSYAEQLRDKEERLRALFSHFEIKRFENIIPSPEIYYYRNKMEYAVGVWDGLKVIGLREKGRFYRVVGLEECRIFNKDVGDIFNAFSKWITDNNIEPYHNTKRSGVLRYLALRHSKYYDQIMAVVVATTEALDLKGLTDELKKFDKIKSVYLCVNDKLSDISLSGDLRLLYGERHIKERISGIDYLISPDSFFQTNSYCCNELYGTIKKEAGGIGGRALDMCCGSGGITLQVAGIFSDVTGVDISVRNIEDALINAELNKISNVSFLCEDAEIYLMRMAAEGQIKNFSAVILDPPRAGLSKKTRAVLSEGAVENIIYVSCNPKILAEDLKTLTESYAIEKMIPVDMFPHTRHVEVIAILKSNKV